MEKSKTQAWCVTHNTEFGSATIPQALALLVALNAIPDASNLVEVKGGSICSVHPKVVIMQGGIVPHQLLEYLEVGQWGVRVGGGSV